MCAFFAVADAPWSDEPILESAREHVLTPEKPRGPVVVWLSKERPWSGSRLCGPPSGALIAGNVPERVFHPAPRNPLNVPVTRLHIFRNLLFPQAITAIPPRSEARSATARLSY
jgi:hypothetical protein